MLHFNWDHCTQDKASGTAQCQADISVEHVWERIEEALK
jgi:hypothetical protein